ncbi:uncharacterized protein LOC122044034 [Zingiber officinale]|uniref:uncharacterized protein LOC122044034 n=1 Tax=Zingiber officinale TaxID=94328 RepID=UPI001C4B38D9|nr:uncharacterized protein LOC122044034 [Zingiber officinale]
MARGLEQNVETMIVDAREKSIIEIFEAIRNLLMRRFQLNREKAEKWNTRNCPRIRAILAKISLEAIKLIPMKSYDMHFQIKATNSQEQHIVDISTNSCSCRQWDLTGIPCKHALCALWCKHEDVEAFVSHYYKTEAYKKYYSRSIMSINVPDLWPDCLFPPPLPPVNNKNKAGKPTKLRRREPDEPPAKCHTKLKAPHRQNKCKRCGHLGHNQRACTDDRNTQQEVKKPNRIEIQIGGSSNTLSNVNVDQSTIIQTPVFVKGGRNYITISRLRSISSDLRRQVQSMSQPVSKLRSGPNISKKRITSSQSSVIKK